MLRKRVHIEAIGDDGVRYNLKLEGDISEEKVAMAYTMLDKLEDKTESQIPDTVGAKIWYVVEKYFGYGGFTSSMVLEKYEDEHNEPIKLSVISTYLARYSSRMKLHRRKTGREWTYAITGQHITQNTR